MTVMYLQVTYYTYNFIQNVSTFSLRGRLTQIFTRKLLTCVEKITLEK